MLKYALLYIVLFYLALCDNKTNSDSPPACTITEGNVQLRDGRTYTSSGGTCLVPGVCGNCNSGYYSDGAYCRGNDILFNAREA